MPTLSGPHRLFADQGFYLFNEARPEPGNILSAHDAPVGIDQFVMRDTGEVE